MCTTRQARALPSRIRPSLCIAVVVSLCAAAGLAAPARAASITPVDCSADPTALVTAFANAGAGDTLVIEGTCTGSLDVAKDITLAGSGDAVLDGQGQAIRVVTIRAGATMTIKSLTITGGRGFAGVGIHNLGTVRLVDSYVRDNIASFWGGGIYNRFGATMDIENSVILGNRAGENAGGIYNDGTLTFTASNVSANNGGLGGGGLFNSSFGTMDVTRGFVYGNEAQYGGGISNSGTLRVADSTISSNRATSGAGIILGGGTALVERTTISENVASGDGGGVNQAGGIYYGGWRQPVLRNSTLAGNSAGGSGGAVANTGYIGSITLDQLTIAGNGAAAGAGVANPAYSGNVQLTGSILAAPAAGQNCSGVITDGGHNLDDGASCGLTAVTSLSGADARLDPSGLAFNGGTTKTVALLTTSPAVDAIPQGSNGCGTTLTADQRGVSRPQGSACDIGAFELEPSPPQVTGHGRFGTDGDWGRVDFTLSNEQVTFDRGTRFSYSGEVESVTGQGKEATLTGTGSWNGRSGYAFEVSVVDNAPWGVYKDTIDVVVRDPAGAVVLTSFGPKLLKQGDIAVTPASG